MLKNVGDKFWNVSLFCYWTWRYWWMTQNLSEFVVKRIESLGCVNQLLFEYKKIGKISNKKLIEYKKQSKLSL